MTRDEVTKLLREASLLPQNRSNPKRGKLYRIKKEIVPELATVNIFEVKELETDEEELRQIKWLVATRESKDLVAAQSRWMFDWLVSLTSKQEKEDLLMMYVESVHTRFGGLWGEASRQHVFLWGNKRIAFGNSLINNHWNVILEQVL